MNSVLFFFFVKYFRIISLLILLIFVSAKLSPADDLLPPTFLSAISDQDGRVPLFWFDTHPDTSELVYHGNGMIYGMFVVPPWHENCAAVLMTSPSLPFYLLKSKIYVSHRRAGPDTNYYDYKAPFFVTVNRDSGGIPQNCFTDSVSAQATGDDSLLDGEWVVVEHDLLMEDSTFWIVFHWLEDYPVSPLVGVDSLINLGNSLCGKRTFFHFEWQKIEHNFMIETNIITVSDTVSDVDSFRVYRSTDSACLIDQSHLIASLPGSQTRYTDSDVTEDQNYFYRVTSVTSPSESPGSNRAEATPKRRAELLSNRDAFVVQISSGEQTIDNLILTNSGGLPLKFKAQIDIKETDWMGESDQFGYSWTDNGRQPELEFAWVDIENKGARIGKKDDDNVDYGFFSLGFPFPFYGSTFDSIRITSDGWLSFSPVIPCYTDSFLCYINKCLPYLWGPYNILAPFWDDLQLTDSSSIYFYSNNSDSAIISFVNFHRYGQTGGGPYTFQVILTPKGEISFQYLRIPDAKYSATVGIQNYDGTMGMNVLCSQKTLYDSLVIKIRPSWVKADSMEGSIQPEENRMLNFTFDPLSYPRGVYHADLLIDSWDKNHQLEPLIIPLTLCIDTTIDTTTSVDWIDSEKPEKITLLQNFPNPFNPVTKIQYTVHKSQTKAAVSGKRSADGSSIHTTLKIYNILGQKVRTLEDEPKPPGNYQAIWDGKDDQEKDVASGIYFYKLTVGSYQKTRKMLLLK